ncbi:hypothetical protein AHF37_10109 [Paragonimus kellicotti]|nr:hypothetical protein AHF37_10109 [Paragonimus kellicotti]
MQNGLFLGIRILPSLFVCFACVLGHFLLAPGFDQCYEPVPVCRMSNCSMETDVYEPNNASVCFTRLTVLIDIVKDVVYSQLILYLVLISFTYANFGQRIWKFRWSTNPSWCFSASIFSVFHRVRKKHFAEKFDTVSSTTVHTQFGQTQSYSTCSDAFELTARLVNLLFPWVLDMNTQGFRVCELIREARCSVNNLYWVITCSVLMPLSAALLQVLLLSAGLPSLPLVLTNASSSSVHLVWLPQQQFRAQLMFLPYQQMWNSSWESFLSSDVIHFNSAYCVPGYGVGQLVWLILIVTPVLSLSMLDRRVDLLRPLQEPPVKRRTSFDRKVYACSCA